MLRKSGGIIARGIVAAAAAAAELCSAEEWNRRAICLVDLLEVGGSFRF